MLYPACAPEDKDTAADLEEDDTHYAAARRPKKLQSIPATYAEQSCADLPLSSEKMVG